MFIHHIGGDWTRSECDTASNRSDDHSITYAHLDHIDNAWLRDTFAWMLDNGMTEAHCGSDTFQIRGQA
jgi:hypothetical protein